MVRIERLCTEIRKCGIESAGMERAMRCVRDEIWDEVVENFTLKRPRREPPVVTTVEEPATVPPTTDPFTSW
jgi:hypothetical protein